MDVDAQEPAPIGTIVEGPHPQVRNGRRQFYLFVRPDGVEYEFIKKFFQMMSSTEFQLHSSIGDNG